MCVILENKAVCVTFLHVGMCVLLENKCEWVIHMGMCE